MLPLAVLALCSPAPAAVDFEGRSFYFGDLHVHSGYSGDGCSADLADGDERCGSVSQFAEAARAAGLDFAALTDHANGEHTMDAEAFAAGLRIALDADDPEGGFVTVPAAELAFDLNGVASGHKNIYFAGSDEELAALTLEDVRPWGASRDFTDCHEIWTFMDEVVARWGDAMLLAHHPALAGGMGTDWSCHDVPMSLQHSPAVEVYSRHGDSTDCPAAFDPAWLGCTEEMAIPAALGEGEARVRLGFVGGTDSHDTRPGGVCGNDVATPQHPYGGGLTVAMLGASERFDRAALFSAIRARRTYATSGPRLPAVLDVAVDGVRAGGMGDVVTVPEGAQITVEVRVPPEQGAFVTKVTVVTSGGEQALEDQGDGAWAAGIETVPIWAFGRVVIDGDAWYSGGACDDGGSDHQELLWLSPVWFTTPSDTGDTATQDSEPPDSEPPDSDVPCDGECTCTCTVQDTGCGFLTVSGLAILAGLGLPLAATRRARRGRAAAG